MFVNFRKRFVKTFKRFLRQDISIGLCITVLICVYQFWTGQISESAFHNNLKSILVPYFVFFGSGVAIISLWTLVRMASQNYPNQGGKVMLTDSDNERWKTKCRYGRWLLAGLSVLLCAGGGLLTARHDRPHQPKAPTGLAASEDYAWEISEGALQSASTSSPCAPRFGRTYPLSDLHSFPGGPTSKRPWLVFRPELLSIVSLPLQPVGTASVMFRVELVNRGETSIVKDWALCLLDNGNPQWFHSVPIPVEAAPGLLKDRNSIDEYGTSKVVEHGQAIRAWALFAVPSKLLMQDYWLGSLQCRDYLDDKVTVTWSYPTKVSKPKSKPSGGLKVDVH